jgi:hypothetical protein
MASSSSSGAQGGVASGRDAICRAGCPRLGDRGDRGIADRRRKTLLRMMSMRRVPGTTTTIDWLVSGERLVRRTGTYHNERRDARGGFC